MANLNFANASEVGRANDILYTHVYIPTRGSVHATLPQGARCYKASSSIRTPGIDQRFQAFHYRPSITYSRMTINLFPGTILQCSESFDRSPAFQPPAREERIRFGQCSCLRNETFGRRPYKYANLF